MAVSIDEFARSRIMEELLFRLNQAGLNTKNFPKKDPSKVIEFLEGLSGDVEQLPQDVRGQIGLTRKAFERADASIGTAKAVSTNIPGTIFERTGGARNHAVSGEGFTLTPEMRSQFAALESEYDAYIKAHPTKLGKGGVGSDFMEFSVLPKDMQDRFKRELRDIFRVDDVVGKNGVSQWVVDPRSPAADVRARPYFRMEVDPSVETNAASVWWQRNAFQFYPEALEGSEHVVATQGIGLSGRQLRLSALERIADQTKNGIPAGRHAILDIETGGLTHESGIWQVSVRYSDSDDVDNLFFRNPYLDRGSTAEGTVQDLLKARTGLEYSSMDDIKRVLKRVSDSDVVSGHNITFDLDFMVEYFGRMSEISKDAREAGRAGLKMDNEAVGVYNDFIDMVNSKRFIDTAELSRQILPRLDLAPEMAHFGGRTSAHSLENILLQTNLLDLAVGVHGEEEVSRQLAKGTHFGDVDTFFEQVLHRALVAKSGGEALLDSAGNPLNLEAVPDWGSVAAGMTDEQKATRLAMRRQVLKSEAITPYTMMDLEDVSPSLRDFLQSQGYYQESTFDTAFGQVTLPGRRISPMQHMILESRMGFDHAPIGDIDTATLGANAGRWQAFSRFDPKADTGFVENLDGSLSTRGHFPTVDEYRVFQQDLDRMGIAHAYLSAPERYLSAALGNAISPSEASQFEQRMASVMGDIIPMSTWHNVQGIQVFGNSHRIAIPWEVLRDAEEAGVFTHAGKTRTGLAAGTEFFSLDPFKTKSGVKSVAKTFLLSSDQGESYKESAELLAFLEENQEKYGISEGLLRQLRQHLDPAESSSARRFGIQVGTLTKPKVTKNGRYAMEPSATAAQAHDALVEIRGGHSVDHTDNTPNFVVSDILGEGDETTTRSGPAMLDIGLKGEAGEENAQRYMAHNEWMKRAREAFSHVDDDRAWDIFSESKKSARPDQMAEFAKFWETKIQPNKRLFAIGAVAAAAMGGYYLYQRHKKKTHFFDEALQPMPYEDNPGASDSGASAYVSGGSSRSSGRGYSPQPVYSSRTGARMNPMDTAGIVQMASDSRMGHTNMDTATKYKHLYGG